MDYKTEEADAKASEAQITATSVGCSVKRSRDFTNYYYTLLIK